MGLLLAFGLVSLGCQSVLKNSPELESKPDFQTIYEKLEAAKEVITDQSKETQLVTISANGWQMGKVARYLSAKYGISMVLAENLDAREITLEVNEQPLAQVLDVIAKRLEVEVVLLGTLYYVGQLNNDDNAVMVMKTRRYDNQEIQNVIDLLLSERGNVKVFPDGVCVISDSISSLDRMQNLLKELEDRSSDVWVVQLHIFSGSEKELLEIGFDSQLSGTISADLQQLNFSDGFSVGSASAEIRSNLEALFSYIRESGKIQFSVSPVFHLLDGETSEYDRTQSVPYRATTTTTGDAAGSRTQTTIDFAQGGVNVQVGINERSRNEAELDLSFSLSQVTARVDGIPGTSAETFRSKTVVREGGLYLVGSFDTKRIEEADQKGFSRFASRSDDSDKLLIWATVSRAGRLATPARLARISAATEGVVEPEFKNLPPMEE